MILTHCNQFTTNDSSIKNYKITLNSYGDVPESSENISDIQYFYVNVNNLNLFNQMMEYPMYYNYQWNLEHMNVYNAWKTYGKGSPSIKIAICDDGIYDTNFLDLSGNLDQALSTEFHSPYYVGNSDNSHGSTCGSIAAAKGRVYIRCCSKLSTVSLRVLGSNAGNYSSSFTYKINELSVYNYSVQVGQGSLYYSINEKIQATEASINGRNGKGTIT